MNVRDQNQPTKAKPAKATSKAGPSKAELLKSARLGSNAAGVAYLVCTDGKSAVVQYEVGGQLCARGYAGGSGKAAWNYRFGDAEKRATHVADWMSGQDASHIANERRKAERKAAPHGLAVGQVLASSWGYDQTNVDFYEVVAVRGAVVDLQEISQARNEDGGMSGTCMPVAGSYCGEVIKGKRPNQYGVRINSCSYASPWNGRPMYWSSYH